MVSIDSRRLGVNSVVAFHVVKEMDAQDLTKALRKVTTKNGMLVARSLLVGGPLAFGELQKRTGMQTNLLNHTLIDMRNLELIKLDNGIYYLTKYCVLLLDSMKFIFESLAEMDGSEIFSPHQEG